MRTESILQQVDALAGMEDFKALCHRLHTASLNAGRLHMEQPPLPNLIFAAAPGCGVTRSIRLLAELLKSLRLLQFTGEEEYFEWALTNEEKAFERFLMRVRTAGGFYGQFRGVIGVDLRRLLADGEDLTHLTRLMAYIEARKGKIVFVIIIPDDVPERTSRQLLGQFASITPAELIHMPFPALEARSFVADRLREKGFTLTEKACALLEDAVARLSAKKEFEGYQTLINLSEDILWRHLSASQAQDAVITEDALDYIFAAGGYCSQLVCTNSHRHIGFSA